MPPLRHWFRSWKCCLCHSSSRSIVIGACGSRPSIWSFRSMSRAFTQLIASPCFGRLQSCRPILFGMFVFSILTPNHGAAANGGFASRFAIQAQRPAVAELGRSVAYLHFIHPEFHNICERREAAPGTVSPSHFEVHTDSAVWSLLVHLLALVHMICCPIVYTFPHVSAGFTSMLSMCRH